MAVTPVWLEMLLIAPTTVCLEMPASVPDVAKLAVVTPLIVMVPVEATTVMVEPLTDVAFTVAVTPD